MILLAWLAASLVAGLGWGAVARMASRADRHPRRVPRAPRWTPSASPHSLPTETVLWVEAPDDAAAWGALERVA